MAKADTHSTPSRRTMLRGAEHMSRGSFKVAWLLLDYAAEIARRMDTGEDVGGLMRGEWEP